MFKIGLKAAAFVALMSGVASAETVSPEWQAVIDAARTEGKVTIYSSQASRQLAELAKRFEARYGIPVEVVRAIDADFIPRIEAEFSTGRGIADVVVNSSVTTVRDHAARGLYVPVTGPNFNASEYKRDERTENGLNFITNATILTYSWNTELVPDGISGYDDIFRPDLEGLIGVPRPSVGTYVDLYHYMADNYGADYLERLAPLKPRVYPSALTMAQALAAGEVAVILASEPQIDEKAQGAPVESGIAAKPWGARFYGNVTKVAPHPNAAQLLADFIVSREGQEAVARKNASVLENVDGAIAYVDSVALPDLSRLTPELVQEFQAKFSQMMGNN